MSEEAEFAEAVERADYLAQKRGDALRIQKESDDYLIESLRGDVARLERELAEARERGYILAMRLLQSDIAPDDVEVAARDAFVEVRREP